MSKKRDPVIAVLKYFQEAELPLAHQALALASQTLKARESSPRLVTKKATSASAPAGPPRVAAGDKSA
jgi:hypothetical protein